MSKGTQCEATAYLEGSTSSRNPVLQVGDSSRITGAVQKPAEVVPLEQLVGISAYCLEDAMKVAAAGQYPHIIEEDCPVRTLLTCPLAWPTLWTRRHPPSLYLSPRNAQDTRPLVAGWRRPWRAVAACSPGTLTPHAAIPALCGSTS